ncbi:hypothetical protein C9374_013584 [Naegleria lovaniensis]|uniref:Uncharacterized protein n=1 Tax=Naegleria lovaniensis TaxID=51637 RepID=A0AA88GWZ9_NAELO|nr:uncharacterized protein C9374_013584 [Naegleria lovaniensis]KAG2392099.1 hypothetical protein C9374_013584 [Naegleria lovaniensis]
MAISVIQQYDFVNQTHWDTLTCDILSYPWRNDLDVVCAMLKRDAFLSIHACTQLLEDKNALLELVKYGPVLRDVSKSIQRAHPEIVVASIQTFYNFLRYANRQTDFIDITRESLEQLIQKKKNLCVKFDGRKIVTEITEKRLQLIFLYSQQRKQHFHLKKIFGSSIEELGYDSEMIVYEFAAQEFGVHKTNDEVIQHFVLPQLKKLANIDALLQDHTDSVLREVIIQATSSLNEK